MIVLKSFNQGLKFLSRAFKAHLQKYVIGFKVIWATWDAEELEKHINAQTLKISSSVYHACIRLIKPVKIISLKSFENCNIQQNDNKNNKLIQYVLTSSHNSF